MSIPILKTMDELLGDPEVFVEQVTAKRGDFVISSELRPVTSADIAAEISAHENGTCNGLVVKDEKSWLYDFRKCALCDRGLGTV